MVSSTLLLVGLDNFLLINMAKRYSAQYDATYDDEKLLWLESVCNDPNCDYCKDRPLFPTLNEEDQILK